MLEKQVQDLAVRAVAEEALFSARNVPSAQEFRNRMVRKVAELDLSSLAVDILDVMEKYVESKPQQSTFGKVVTIVETMGIPLLSGLYVQEMYKIQGNHLYNFSMLAATILGLSAQAFVNKHYRETDERTLNELRAKLHEVHTGKRKELLFRILEPAMPKIEEQFAPYGVAFK